MSRSCQPLYVADRVGVLHIEDELLCEAGRARISVTRCGLRLNFDSGEAAVRLFHLSYSDLYRDPCDGCANG